MKKIVSLILFSLLLISLFGCGGNQTPENNPPTNETPTQTQEDPTSPNSKDDPTIDDTPVIKRLDTPEISCLDNVILWTNVEGATQYELVLNGQSILITTNSYTVEVYGAYTCKVKAISDDVLPSLYSTEISFEYVEKMIGNLYLNCSSISLTIEEECYLLASTQTETNVKVTYEVSQEGIITIDEEGKITPLAIGSTIITAKQDGYISASCFIQVKPTLSASVGSSIVIDEGDLCDLQVVTNPLLDPEDILFFYSEDESIAFVGNTGIVNGVHMGETNIHIECTNGAKTVVHVKVNELIPAVVTFTVTLPEAITTGYEIYLVGSFNNWTTCDISYKLEKVNSTTFKATFYSFKAKTSISYKYILKTPTSYCWEAYNGDNLANRSLNIKPSQNDVNDRITLWQAPTVVAS